MTSWRDLAAQGVIVCPADRGTLTVGTDTLRCASCSRVYRIEDEIPVLLISDAVVDAGHTG